MLVCLPLPGGGGGGTWLDTPPKSAQLIGDPKTNLGTSTVSMEEGGGVDGEGGG